MKSLYAIVFISIVLVGCIHAAPKFTNSQEQRANYLEALFSDDNMDDDYIDDDDNDDDNMEYEIIDEDNMKDEHVDDVNTKDEYIDDANMEDDQFDYDNVGEQKNEKRTRCWVQEKGQGCWTDRDCCGSDLKCKVECAMCDGTCLKAK